MSGTEPECSIHPHIWANESIYVPIYEHDFHTPPQDFQQPGMLCQFSQPTRRAEFEDKVLPMLQNIQTLMTSIQTIMNQSREFNQSHVELESQMELTDWLIAKILSRDKQLNVFTEHVGIESQFEI